MKDQHTKITGYRSLSQDEIDLMNKIKLHGQVLQELVAEVKLHLLQLRQGASQQIDDAEKNASKRPSQNAGPRSGAPTSRKG